MQVLVLHSKNEIMYKCILFIAIFLYNTNIYSQNNIDYNHKSINKLLVKINKTEKNELLEIEILPSIIDETNLNGKYFEIKNSDSSSVKYIYIGRVNSCRVGGCSISREIKNNEEHEYFDYFIFYDRLLNVKLVKVFNYQASHGQEITAIGWLKQFIGYNVAEDLIVGKNIDAISGATISVYGITFDVQYKTELLSKVIEKL